ncbi:MAG: hypothetical protein FJZ16_09535 [Candidatus Omnitrophica bacterium]|nr:hypothetical protein [Candidatus Omnitrophota bacterium]
MYNVIVAENALLENEVQVITGEREGNNRADFLRASETAGVILDGLGLQGFQLGGGAVDFALGRYRRPHGDIDVVYVVDSATWGGFLKNPRSIPAERSSLLLITQEPELCEVKQTRPIEMEKMGAPGVRMEGGDFPITADFVEAYRDTIEGEEFIILPLYDGTSYIKIPQAELRVAEIDGIRTVVPSPEVQFILKAQMIDTLVSLKAGLLPDRRGKAKIDIADLGKVADEQKIKDLKRKGVGFNLSPISAARFISSQLLGAII